MRNHTGLGSALGAIVLLTGAAGCREPGDWGYQDTAPAPAATTPPAPTSTPSGSSSLFQGQTVRASGKVAPVAGGTLLVTKSGHAIASDPDRDVAYVADLSTQKVTTVPLLENDEPGRVVEGPAGTAFIVARRGGAVIAVDTAAGTARRFPVCSAPRGLAYDADFAKLYVACRSGLLAELNAQTGEVTARHQLEPDLRDVLLLGEDLVVTRFKSAEMMVVARDGKVLRRSAPNPQGSLRGASVTPTVAFRALALPSGGVLVGHVDSSDATLPSGAGAYYGASCGGSVADLTATVMNPAGTSSQTTIATVASSPIGNASGPLDIAVSADGMRVALLAVGNAWNLPNGATRANLFLASSAEVTSGGLAVPCGGAGSTSGTSVSVAVGGEPVAVAFDANGRWVAQSREPARLTFEGGATLSLATDSRFDTGFAMFHLNTGGGIACASCHPEAGEDGHTWQFSFGPRRSQTLEGGASQRAPFHWSGDLGDFDALVDEVMMKRMSLFADVDPGQRAALRDWLDSVPKAPTADGLDPRQVERGRLLFNDEELACATCHSGSDYTDNLAHDVGTGEAFVTPSLVDVNMRAPLFHDGCAATLAGRFGPCGGGDKHGITSRLTRGEEADLVAFMQSL
ncbi:MAG: cytochrome-c peroxidase [Myxococcales bacterium]|nr:MAG: cytochrome-c peroxidase [Myxococcales bacterium]